MGLADKIISMFKSSNQNFDVKDKKKPLSRQVGRRVYRSEISMKRLKAAVIAAENLIPRRLELYELYHQIMEDDHLLAQVRTARFNIQMGDFVIRKGKPGTESVDLPELTDMLDKTWFFEYLEHCVDTELWGHTLIELMADKEGMISECIIVPRQHVRPEDQLITYMPSDLSGLNYIENPDVAKRVVECGNRQDLGLLKVISKLVIRKEYTLSDWAIRNEKFGMPYTILKTASRDSKELDAKENMMKNFGSNMWAILDDEDTVELKEALSNTGAGHKSFSDFADYIDSAISIIVNGQTATTQENAFVGSSEVQERQLNKYTLARMKRIQYHINDRLIPHLNDRGYPLEGCKFYFRELEKSEDKTEDGMKQNNKADNTKTKPDVK